MLVFKTLFLYRVDPVDTAQPFCLTSCHSGSQGLHYICVQYVVVFRRVRKSAKSDLASSCLSVCPHGATRLPLDGVLLKSDK